MSSPANNVLRTTWQALLFAWLWLPLFALATPAADERQPVPALTGPVVDLAEALDPQQREQISQKLRALHEKYGPQMQVLIVPTTQPETAFDYSMRVVEAWQVGSKEKDDGLLLLIAMKDRKTQIQTGYGLEAVIPDIVAKSLLSDTLAPYLRNGDVAGGINAVIDAAFQRISGEVTGDPVPKEKERVEQADWVALVIVGGLVTAIFSKIVGRLLGSGLGATGVFFTAMGLYGTSLFLALLLAVITPFVARLFLQGGQGRQSIGGFSGGGGFGGGGGSSWSGGGGSFGGGGAGGSW